MNETWAAPKPWETLETGTIARDEYMNIAFEAEKAGKRLVVHSFVNAYPDPADDGSSWFVDTTIVSDWRTGEVLLTYTTDNEDPDTSGWFNVDNRLVEEE